MHLLVRESRSLDDEAGVVELGHSPADLVLLSFSDADLGAAASAWEQLPEPRPTLRLANLAALAHPMSVDLYAEQVIARARYVVVRLLGGIDYWRYGAEELSATCRRAGVALAFIPGDERRDAALAELSTVPAADLCALDGYFRQGGAANLGQALRLAGGQGATRPVLPLPQAGEVALDVPATGPLGVAAIVFYRSHLLSGDIAPITAMAEALTARGLGVRAIYVASLKEPDAAALTASLLREWRPSVVLTATNFSARTGDASPLDAAGAPVLQLVLAGGPREAWEASTRGLSPADLAMQVVLPELDGRLLTTAISFKTQSAPHAGLQFSRMVHAPDAAGVALAADRAAGWARLAATPRAERKVALILSDYPGAHGGQVGHAVGLDSLASVDAIGASLRAAGYDVPAGAVALCHAERTPTLDLGTYRQLFATLPEPTRAAILTAWGEPFGPFRHAHVRLGNLTVAVQPDRQAGYHDPDAPPCHGYVAFYLWLRGHHAMVHLGAHGTLEWLPGKAVALSAACTPAALVGGMPVVYPFIANNPGEAAAAKRRLGAVVLGHLTPPLTRAGTHGAAREVERLLDDYAAADGLDRRRTTLLRRDILIHAAEAGLLAESGVAPGTDDDAALARLDAYLCDVKDMQIRDGLHVFGRAPDADARGKILASLPAGSEAALDQSAPAEMAALLAALDGRFVAPGPAGAPTRGRADVLPTGRNLYSIDPRAVPTRAAMTLATRAAADLLRRHVQDHGDWPRRLVVDLWGSATMRTGGEELALALILIGAAPVWDAASNRVSAVEIVPLALLDRPRVDVTLRISGLFRDAFGAQIELFDMATRMVAARDEDATWNPLAASGTTARVFGPAPGGYGAGVSDMLARDVSAGAERLGAAYLAASGHGYGRDGGDFAARVATADAFVRAQDHAEMDVLEGTEHAAHSGGFAAAATLLGGTAALYHLDTSRPDAPCARTLVEEIARVTRGRAANPVWIAGQMRHGYRGGAEILRAVEGLHAFAATVPARFDAQFSLLFDATLGEPAVDAFLCRENPQAREAMRARFEDARARDLWRVTRNSTVAMLA